MVTDPAKPAAPISADPAAADSGAADSGAPDAAGRQAAEAKAAFDAAYQAYKAELVAIEALRSEFQAADAARREAIDADLRRRHPQSVAVLQRMVAAAIAAYEAAPESDPAITNLLVTVAAHRIAGSDRSSQGGDDYEAALEVIRMLIDGGNKNQQLPVWGIVAAFTTNNLELAEKYEQLARESGALAGPPESDNPTLREVYGLAMGMAASIADQKEQWAAEKKIRDAEAAANDLPRVRIETTEGAMIVELFENEAPQTVASFITLIKQGFYDGVVFHRVLPRFMAQGGDPTGTGSGGPGYNIRCECWQPNARKHFRGSLSMAHAGRDTGGSQFFLTFLPTAHLNPNERLGTGHTVFGRVIEGLDVLAKLIRVDPDVGSNRRSEIVKATVIRDRGHDYSTRFDRLPSR